MKNIFVKSNTFLLSILSFVFCSCMSTREYIKTQKTFYEDEIAIEESHELLRDRKLIETSSKKFYDLADVCTRVNEDEARVVMNAFTAVKEADSKAHNDEITFSLMEYQADKATNEVRSFVLGTKSVKAKDGKVVSTTDSSGKVQRAKGEDFGIELEPFFYTNLDALVAAMYSESESDEEKPASAMKDIKRQEITASEKVIVESQPNGNYIFYSIAGKPFVILGTATWNILKCLGYAVINFGGGYNFMTGKSGGRLWMLPDYKKSKEKAAEAKEANKIPHYPEYHLPFTNNHIVVEKYDRDISVIALADDNSEEIIPIERYEYDNTMSVERSAKADAASTAATAGLIGTIVTIPISVVSWLGGAFVGVYYDNDKK